MVLSPESSPQTRGSPCFFFSRPTKFCRFIDPLLLEHPEAGHPGLDMATFLGWSSGDSFACATTTVPLFHDYSSSITCRSTGGDDLDLAPRFQGRASTGGNHSSVTLPDYRHAGVVGSSVPGATRNRSKDISCFEGGCFLSNVSQSFCGKRYDSSICQDFPLNSVLVEGRPIASRKLECRRPVGIGKVSRGSLKGMSEAVSRMRDYTVIFQTFSTAASASFADNGEDSSRWLTFWRKEFGRCITWNGDSGTTKLMFSIRRGMYDYEPDEGMVFRTASN